MIERFQLLRNIGQFDNVSPGPQTTFTKAALVYGENGRGKTTLAAILRSLAVNDPSRVTERKRLGAVHDPHVIVATNSNAHIFQNGAWSAPQADIVVFDDEFVAQNVCSGIEIGSSHRQNLHELILGAQGVALSSALQTHVEQIEVHNRTLRLRSDAIPATIRGALSVDEFCALLANPDIDQAIGDAERSLAAANASDAIRRQSGFEPLGLPGFEVAALQAVLGRDLPDLQRDAAEHVRAHFAQLGPGGEAWVSEGMGKIGAVSADPARPVCPFCVQDLGDSPIIRHYEAYFSETYSDLVQTVSNQLETIESAHGGDVPASFERSVRIATQTQEFWSRFAEMPAIELDTAAIARAWNTARETVLAALRAKQASPLDRMTLSAQALVEIQSYDTLRNQVRDLSDSLQSRNQQIQIVKEQAAAADIPTLTRDLTRLKAIKARHSEPASGRCQDYLAEKAAKALTEANRDQARAALENYRQNIFPAYEVSINNYLQRFNAGFRLARVESVNIRAGSACQYSVVINNVEVTPTAAEGPSFRNTLSAGDRNTLALAFFFASLDQDAAIAQKIVVIDDPMTSLDEHRSLTTVQEIRRLTDRVSQVIVLSHSKPFLCALWAEADQAARSAAIVTREGDGSTIRAWDVNQDSVTAHDRRYDLVKRYLTTGDPGEARSVAQALRPMLEAFLRVAYPADFPPGSLIGANFLPKCRQRAGTPDEIVSQRNIDELQDILDYANRFHHDTNPAYETEAINDQELAQFARRTLLFIQLR